jgi:hypothetical protein
MTQRTNAIGADGTGVAAFTDDDELDAATLRALAVEAGATPQLIAALLDQLEDED